MDLNKLTLFGLMKGRMAYGMRRQEVLAQNVANADTPNYKPQDLKPFNFQDYMKNQAGKLPMKRTDPLHFSGTRDAMAPFATSQTDQPFETAPNGNAVVLDEQMAKVNENQIQLQFANELYRKHMSMIKIALGKGR